jgi:uncharacterized DUF497 family protein
MYEFRWNADNEDHIAEHGIAPAHAEYVVQNARPPYPEYRGDGKWRVWGQTSSGDYLQVVFVFDPDGTVYVIHARPLKDIEKRRLRRRIR